jgi:hypothetical protein
MEFKEQSKRKYNMKDDIELDIEKCYKNATCFPFWLFSKVKGKSDLILYGI